jgi:hypothetical protein
MSITGTRTDRYDDHRHKDRYYDRQVCRSQVL